MMQEELLEPVARYFRFIESIRFLRAVKPKIIADIGCGPLIRYYHFLKKHNLSPTEYIGIDPLADSKIVKKYSTHPHIKIRKSALNKKLPLEKNSIDAIVGFAFLEHIDYPGEILNSAIDALRPGGIGVFTTPSFYAKGILEFLSFKLGIISPREIEEHKNYFNKEVLLGLISTNNKEKVHIIHEYFEFGVNNLLVVQKKSQ